MIETSPPFDCDLDKFTSLSVIFVCQFQSIVVHLWDCLFVKLLKLLEHLFHLCNCNKLLILVFVLGFVFHCR